MPLFFTKQLFKRNVMVCGERGTGKDMLFGNVIARRRSKAYIGNTDYVIKNKLYIPLEISNLHISNDYRNFLTDNIKKFTYKYPDGIDIYLADCGVYFPSQYCNELNRDYKDITAFLALSRHLGDCNVHTNCQALNRVWDKLREQSHTYISCQWCKVLKLPLIKKPLVIQRIRIYERYQSALDNIAPFRAPFSMDKGKRELYAQSKVNYLNAHGSIKTRTLIYFNKCNYDTRHFKEVLKYGN